MFENKFSVYLGKYLEVGLLSHMTSACLTFKETSKLLSSLYRFTFPIAICERFSCSAVSPALGILRSFLFLSFYNKEKKTDNIKCWWGSGATIIMCVVLSHHSSLIKAENLLRASLPTIYPVMWSVCSSFYPSFSWVTYFLNVEFWVSFIYSGYKSFVIQITTDLKTFAPNL